MGLTWIDPVLSLLRRFWWAIPIAVLSALLVIRTDQRNDAREATVAAQNAHRLFIAQVRATAEAIQRRAAERNLRVEREQNQITQEVSREYDARIADVRRRAAALRVPGAATVNPGGGGNPMPSPGSAAGQPDGPAADRGLSLDERLIATEQAIQLEELQNWVRRQLMVPRN